MKDLNFCISFGTNKNNKRISFCIDYDSEADSLLIADTSAEFVNTGNRIEKCFEYFDKDTDIDGYNDEVIKDISEFLELKHRWSGNNYRNGTKKQRELLLQHGKFKESYSVARDILVENNLFWDDGHAYGSKMLEEALPQQVIDDLLQFKNKYYFDDPDISDISEAIS